MLRGLRVDGAERRYRYDHAVAAASYRYDAYVYKIYSADGSGFAGGSSPMV